MIANCPVPCRPGSLSVAVTYQSTGSGCPCGQTFTCSVVDGPVLTVRTRTSSVAPAVCVYPVSTRLATRVSVVPTRRATPTFTTPVAENRSFARYSPAAVLRGAMLTCAPPPSATLSIETLTRASVPDGSCPRASWRASGCSCTLISPTPPATEDPETALQAPPTSAVPQPLAEVRSNSSAASTVASVTVTGCVTDPDAPRLSTTVSVTS